MMTVAYLGRVLEPNTEGRHAWLWTLAPPLGEALAQLFRQGGAACPECGADVPFNRIGGVREHVMDLELAGKIVNHVSDSCPRCGSLWHFHAGRIRPRWLALFRGDDPATVGDRAARFPLPG